MDLNSLLYFHQRALIDRVDATDLSARQWAGHCADHYAGQLEKLRQRLGVASRTFDYRDLAAPC